MKTVILYTDGACSGNPGPGGWAGSLTRSRICPHSLAAAKPAGRERNALPAYRAVDARQPLGDDTAARPTEVNE